MRRQRTFIQLTVILLLISMLFPQSLFAESNLNNTNTNKEASSSITDTVYSTVPITDTVVQNTYTNHPTNKYIVKLFDKNKGKKESAEYEKQSNDSFIQRNQAKIKKQYKYVPILLMELSDQEKQILEASGEVEYIEPDNRATVAEITYSNPNDDAITWGYDALFADKIHTSGNFGQGIKIAIVDTGIDLTHNDLHVAGGTSIIGISNQDDNGHGTQVAGVIGAKINHSGIKGIAPQSEIFAVKAFDQYGEGTYSQIISAIDWSIENHMNIINMSFSGESHSIALQEALRRAYDSGILLVGAAGNNSSPNLSFPAQYPTVMAIGSVDFNMQASSFSNYGERLEVVAPGSKIYTTDKGNKYTTAFGTSLSAAYVSGSAAAVWSAHPEWSAEQVRIALLRSASHLGTKDRYGYGLINPVSAISQNYEREVTIDINGQINGPLNEDGKAHVAKLYKTPSYDPTINAGQSITTSIMIEEAISEAYIGVFDPNNIKIVSEHRVNGVDGADLSQYATIPFTWYTSPGSQYGTYTIKYAFCYNVPDVGFGCPSSDDEFWHVTVNPPASSDTVPPTAVIDVPDLNKPFFQNKTISIHGTGYDNVGVQSISLYADGFLVDTRNASDATFSWAPSTSGIHRLYIEAEDTSGNKGVSSVYELTAAQADTIAPTVSINVPDENKPFIQKKNVLVEASASDNSGIQSISLLVDNNITETKYGVMSTEFNWLPMTAGLHTLKLAATDLSGNIGYSDDFTVDVQPGDTTNPVVIMNKDSNNKYVEKNKIKMNYSASDNVSISSLTLRVEKDGEVLYEALDVTGTNSYELYVYNAGQYHVVLTAKDPSGNIGTDFVDFWVDIERHVALFIPGILGTEIYTKSLVGSPQPDKLWPTALANVGLLGLPNDGIPTDSFIGDVFESFRIPGVVNQVDTEEFLTELRKHMTIIKVPYDWRIDLDDSKTQAKIDEMVNQALVESNGQDITIITHSMGGLPARKYLIDHPNAKVKNFIPIAAPFLGSPRSMKGIEIGDDLDVSSFGFFPWTRSKAKQLVQNMTSVYELLPGEGFVNAYKQRYTGTDFPYESFFTDYSDHARFTYGFVNNYAKTSQYISDMHNSTLYNKAKSFRNYIENNEISNHVKEYRIAGYGWPTVIKIEKADQWVDPALMIKEEKYHIYFSNGGDSVVPTRSADFNRINRNNNAEYFYYNNSHIGLLGNQQVRDLISDIVTKSDSSSGSTAIPNDYLSGESVEINCPVNVMVTDDQGNTAGLNADGILENHIPGLTYEIFGTTKALYILDGLNMHFSLSGYDAGSMDISFSKYSNDLPIVTNSLQHVEITNNTAVSFTLNGNIANASLLDVNYDRLGNGQIQVLHPSVQLTPAEYRDLIAPVTTATISGQKVNGWYSQDVTITLKATDVGVSGVTKTVYQIDNGSFNEYSVPINLTTEGIHTIKYYSVDKAGNYEGALSETLQIDKTPPTSPGIALSTANWTNQDVVFTIQNGTDNLSGVQKSQYRIGNGNWIDYSSAITVSTEGQTPVYARTIDNAGNISSVTTVTIKIDKTPPSAPNILSFKSKTSTSINLTWSNAWDNFGVKEYEIYSGSTKIGVSTQNYYNATGLSSNLLQEFSVKAVDNAGNVSAPSSSLKVFTSSPSLSAGNGQSFAIKSDGTVYGWGKNDKGQLGDSTVVNKTIPTVNNNLNSFSQISPGTTHSLGIKNDGTVWAWGDNTTGALGNDTVQSSTSNPIRVQNMDTVIAVAAGAGHSIALKADGTVWTWGANDYGMLGDGTKNSRRQPVKVQTLDSIIAIAAGTYHSMALKSDGTIWAWGGNVNGQLGDGTTVDKVLPVQVGNLNGVIRISAGFSHSLALKKDGTVWAWGVNGNGQLGDGTQNQKTNPLQVVNMNSVVDIVAGFDYSAVLKSDGTVWTWGGNTFGELGTGAVTGTQSWYLVPSRVSHLNSATGIAAGQNGYYVLVSRSDSSVWSWGDNQFGQLGDSTNVNKKTRIPVKGFTALSDNTAPIAPQNLQSSKVTSTTVTLIWSEATDNTGVTGYNVYKGSTLVGSTTVDDKTSAEVTSYTVNGLLMGQSYTFTVKAKDGFGNESQASNSLSVTTTQTLPVSISSGYNHTILLKDDGTVWAWGNNDFGQLGDLGGTQKTAPVVVPGLNSIVAIAAGDQHNLALKNDGTVWAWGYGDSGQLGNNANVSQSTPVQVLGLSNVIAIAAGGNHSLALKRDGTVWAWGANDSGQLGDGAVHGQEWKPIQASISSVISISAGYSYSIALKNDGTVWSWGSNSSGQLGDGTMNQRTRPVAVSNLSGITAISAGFSHNMALKSNGTLWTWGSNTFGKLGDGTTATKTLPVQLNGITNVKGISAGYDQSVAVKTDGTIWAWGYNAKGQLGDGTQINKLTPVKVLNVINPLAIDAGGWHIAMLKVNGAAWAWGWNGFGQLGDSTSIDRNVPVQVSGLNIVDDVSPPTAPILSTNGKTGSSVSLNWTASTDNVGVTGYLIFNGSTLVDTTTATSYIVVGLNNNTTYTFTVKATDAMGNLSPASNAVTTTTLDTTPPTAPTNLVSTSKNDTSVTISWTASTDNVGVVGYDIYSDSNLVGTTNTTSFTITGLISNTAYTFMVKAKDAAGNVSLPSNVISVTTN